MMRRGHSIDLATPRQERQNVAEKEKATSSKWLTCLRHVDVRAQRSPSLVNRVAIAGGWAERIFQALLSNT